MYRKLLYRSVDYSRVCIIGDLHGDLQVYLRFLLETDACNPDSIVPLLDYLRSGGTDFHTIEEFLARINWSTAIGLNILLVFVGDVVDNIREGTASEFNQNLDDLHLIRHMVKLYRHRPLGTDLVFLLGNHELSNLFDHLPCSSYTPGHYCQQVEGRSCYSLGRKTELLEYLRQLTVRTAVVVDDCLVCHGGLSSAFSARLTDLVAINTVYEDCIEHFIDPRTRVPCFGSLDPVWYRPLLNGTQVQQDRDSLTRLTLAGLQVGLRYSIVGHTTVRPHDYSRYPIFGYIYPCDFGMSMTTYSPNPVFGFLCIVAGGKPQYFFS